MDNTLRKVVRLSPSWVETIDPNSGRPYYANTKTKQTLWTKPEEEIRKENEEEERKKKGNGNSKPDTWVERQDPRTGRTYYYNPALRETSWHRPDNVIGTDVHTMTASKGAWVERVDPRTGRTYYFNPVLGRTSWVNPDAEEESVLQSAAQTDKQSAFKRISMNMVNRLSGAFGVGGGAGSKGASTAPNGRNSARYSMNTPALPVDKTAARTSLRIGYDPNNTNESEDKFANLRALQTMKPKARLSMAMNNVKPGDALLLNLEKEMDGVNLQHQLLDFSQYAQANFNLMKKGFMSKKQVPIQQLIFHQRNPITTSLHSFGDKNLNADSVLAFKLILWYCGEKPTKKAGDVLAQEFAAIGMNTIEQLQAELYCLLIKQSTKNPSPQSLEQVWELMALISGCFAPPELMMPYVLSHLRSAIETPPSEHIARLARYAMLRLERYVNRLEPPSLQEVAAVRSITPVDLRISLISAPPLNIQVDSWVSIKDIRKSIETNFQIKDGSPFTLFENNAQDQERVLEDDDNILDLIAFWERLGGGYDCLYKMRLFFDISEDDTAAIELAYLQAVSEVLGEAYPCSQEDAITLAAFEAQEKFGDYNGTDVFAENLAGYIPPKYYDPSMVDVTKGQIYREYQKLEGADKLQCMINYLNFIKQWKYYGSAYYHARPVQLKILGKEFPPVVYMGINAKGVLIIDPPSLNLIAEYPYSEIVTWGHSVENFVLVIGNMVRSTKLFFHTDDGQEMNSLISTYVKKLMEAQTEEEQDQMMMQQFQ